MMMNQKQLEEFAFYKSGLSADGCLQNKPIMVVGESLYNEIVDAIKMYEDYNPNT